MDNGLSVADIASVVNPRMNGYDAGFGDGNGWWIILILLFALCGNGLGYNRDAGRYATVEDVNSATNFSRLENQVRMNENTIQQGFMNTANGICDSTFALNNTITNEGRGIQTQIADCCCSTKNMIMENRYLSEKHAADINANTTAQTQKILDKLCENEINALRSKVSALELQSSLCGVVRYPLSTTYNAGFNPFCSAGCGCGNI